MQTLFIVASRRTFKSCKITSSNAVNIYLNTSTVLWVIGLVTWIFQFHAITLRPMSNQLHGMSELTVASFALKGLYLGVFSKMWLQVPFVMGTVIAMFTGYQWHVMYFCVCIEVTFWAAAAFECSWVLLSLYAYYPCLEFSFLGLGRGTVIGFTHGGFAFIFNCLRVLRCNGICFHSVFITSGNTRGVMFYVW